MKNFTKNLAVGSLVCFSFLKVETALADPLEGKRSPAEIIAATSEEDWRNVDPAQVMVIELERGRVTVELSDIFAQGHVAQTKTLVKAGFYDGLSFYRVIDGFVAQGGDPFNERELPKGTAKELKAEFDEELPKRVFVDAYEGFVDSYNRVVGIYQGFPMGAEHENSKRNWLLHCTGAFAFGRNVPRDSASTEFYITLQPQRYLDRNLTVFGKVIDGMEHLQALKRQLPPETKEEPLGDTIIRAWMGDQAPEGESVPQWQVIRTDTETFAEYVESRRNRPEAFFYYRPNRVDVCAVQIPVREKVISLQGNER